METGFCSLSGIFTKIKLLACLSETRISRCCRSIEEYFLQETWEQEFLLWRTLAWKGQLIPRLRSQKGSDPRQKGSQGLARACCFCCQLELAIDLGPWSDSVPVEMYQQPAKHDAPVTSWCTKPTSSEAWSLYPCEELFKPWWCAQRSSQEGSWEIPVLWCRLLGFWS